jgi:DNA-binding NarL/FixJ family response regulator
MDLHMPILDGVAATRRLQSEHPAIKVLVLTTFDDDEDVFEGLHAGAVGYLLKDVPSEKLVEAMRGVARGPHDLACACHSLILSSEDTGRFLRTAENISEP